MWKLGKWRKIVYISRMSNYMSYTSSYGRSFLELKVILKLSLGEVKNMGKVVQLSVTFYRGCPMKNYPSLSGFLHFSKVWNYPNSHWSEINRGRGLASCLVQVEKEDMKAKLKQLHFIALSLNEVTTIDNTPWVWMHVSTVNDLFVNLLYYLLLKWSVVRQRKIYMNC